MKYILPKLIMITSGVFGLIGLALAEHETSRAVYLLILTSAFGFLGLFDYIEKDKNEI